MHPAPSVIIFTTFSGLGFGLLMFLGLGYPNVTGMMAFGFYLIAYVFAVGGLLASTFHLGHPERALKAFSQWRSSWLSREAWFAVAALVVMGLVALGQVFFDTRFTLLGVLGAALSFGTVLCTAMIYTQLKTVPRWNTPITPVLFVALSLTGGALLSGRITLTLVLLVITGAIQLAYWIWGDSALQKSGTTLETATGLGEMGRVRAFEPPHTGTNYLLKEFAYVVGRKHAAKLRIISLILMVGTPLVLLALPFNHWFALFAVLSHILGVMTSRWLFFAQAEHVVGLYYGKR